VSDMEAMLDQPGGDDEGQVDHSDSF
jgi:hypothetical protein